jgi:hypothetical protein
MVYDIEFIRRIDGKAEMIAQEVVSLVGESLAMVVAHARDAAPRWVPHRRERGRRL